MLLSEVSGGKVSRFDPETDLRSLSANGLQAATGYLLEMTPGQGSPAPTAVHMDRMAGLLAERDCYMAMIVPHDARYRMALSEYVTDCPPPDAQALLDRLVQCAADDRPDIARALRGIAEDPPLALS